MLVTIAVLLRDPLSWLRPKHQLALESLALRHPISVLMRQTHKPKFHLADRLIWILLKRCCAHWKRALMILQPETVIGWHRAGVFDALTGWAVCPGAVSILQEEYNFGPVTTSPSGMTGHQVEWTCTFEDGTQKVIPNEELALKGMGASFTAVGICSGVLILLLMVTAAVAGGRLVKPKDPTA